MKHPRHAATAFIGALATGTLLTMSCSSPTLDGTTAHHTLQEQIQLPPGFTIDVYATNLTRPRSLALGDEGTVFAGTYWFTKGLTSPVYAMRDTDEDHRADVITEIRHAFNTPNGIAYHNGNLYVVDEDRLFRIDAVEANLENPNITLLGNPLPSRLQTDSATALGHWWRYLVIGPDDQMYVAVGTRWSIGVSDHVEEVKDDPIFSTIVRMDLDAGNLQIHADGVRNSMGMDFDPVTGDLWFTDNGPSWPFEDPRFYDIPPDELNHVRNSGEHFGFPHRHGTLADPFVGSDPPAQTTDPEFEFLAHSAPLGMRFYTGSMFPARYRNAIFVVEHGIEASTPAPLSKLHGDRIAVIHLDDSRNVVEYEVFADGFRQGSNAEYTRRPVDLLVMPDGALLVSDDQANVIYRISYDP